MFNSELKYLFLGHKCYIVIYLGETNILFSTKSIIFI